MERRFLPFFAFILVVLALSIAGPSSAKMPLGAFVTKTVSSPSELGDLIDRDRVTGLRYSKHYGMSPNELSHYIKDNLVVYTLPKTRTFTTYYVTKSGRIIEHEKTLKAGSRVLASPKGVPVIDLRCGNPLGKSLPKVVSQVQSSKQTTPPATQPTTPAEVAAQPPMKDTLVAAAPAESVVPQPIQEAVLAEPPFELPIAAATPISALASSGANWLAPALLGAGAIGTLVGGRGGGSTVVPEPSSMMALGMGAMMLMAQFRKKRTSIL